MIYKASFELFAEEWYNLFIKQDFLRRNVVFEINKNFILINNDQFSIEEHL